MVRLVSVRAPWPSCRGVLRVSLRYEWASAGTVAHGSAPEMQNMDVVSAGLARWGATSRTDVIHGPVSTLPQGERDFFAALGIHSIAAIPVFAGENWWGYLAVTDDASEREWSPSVLEALQAAAAALGAAIYRKRAEEDLRDSEQRFRGLSDAAVEGVLIHENGVLMEANEALARMLGYEVRELVGKNVFDFITVPKAREQLASHMRSGSEQRIEVSGTRKDGAPITVELSGRPTSYRGRPARVATVHDITERKEAEAVARRLIEEQSARAAAEDAGRRAAFLAEASRVLGTSFDYQTTLATLARVAVPMLADFCTVDLLASDGGIERVGVAHVDPAKELLLWDFVQWVRKGAPMVEHLQRAMKQGLSTIYPEITHAMLMESAIDEEHARLLELVAPRSIVTVPLQTSTQIIGVLVLYTSESGRHFGPDDLALAEELARRASLAVENARLFHEAETATRARDQMLGVVAHDLRNPLGTIVMAAELLEEAMGPESNPSRKHLAIIRRAGERMNRLIQDLLDVKRMENGRLSVDPKPVPAGTLLGEAVEMLRTLAAGSTIELVLTPSNDLPSVLADQVRVQQVLSNLIGNAIKFTPKGGRITVHGETAETHVRVAVSDTGPGIAADQLPHIFAQYWQGARTDRRGIGLGLAIAKGIVEAHNGRIWVESVVGQGSTFYFTLPVSEKATAV